MRYLNLFVLLVALSCNQSSKKLSLSASNIDLYGDYIQSYTNQDISVHDHITIVFAKEVTSIDEIGKELPQDLIEIKPYVKGKAFWKNSRTFTFIPDEKLAFGNQYSFKIFLDKLYTDIPKEMNEVELLYNTAPLHVSVSIAQSYAVVSKDIAKINGNINASDGLENEEVENMIKASSLTDKDLNISWIHHTPNSHEFEITTPRTEKENEITITWNDNKYNSGFEGKKIIPIHAKGDFKVINVNSSNQGTRSISVHFSDVLDNRQAFDGLVTITNFTGTYRYEANGSVLNIFPSPTPSNNFELNIDKSIQSVDGSRLTKSTKNQLTFAPVAPQLKLSGKGVIVPSSDELIFPFEAINLEGITVEIFKIYSNNVMQFLQYNTLDATHNLEAVGNIIHQEKVDLTKYSTDDNSYQYVRYALDLNDLVALDPGSIYQVRIGFGPEDVRDYPCTQNLKLTRNSNSKDGFVSIFSRDYYYYDDEYGEYYYYDDLTDPCQLHYYYGSKFITRNVLASNIGIVAKIDPSRNATVVLSDLRTLSPIVGAKATFYDFQQQEIGSTTSAKDGIVRLALSKNPSFVLIHNNAEYGVLDLQDNHTNSLSEFDVDGSIKPKGLDAYIYGDRGVWRPGDTIFLSFMFEDVGKKIPSNHPVHLTVNDARGKTKLTTSSSKHLDRLYTFAVPTGNKDVTGTWKAIFKVGDVSFTKNLRVETIKPNRLKIKYDLDLDKPLKLDKSNTLHLASHWLHGASGKGLKSKVDLQLKAVPTKFVTYSDYTFDDIARTVSPLPTTIYDGVLDESGKAKVIIQKQDNWLYPGKIKANITTRVYEDGGNFSEDNISINADIYDAYVGIKVPTSRWGEKFIDNNGSSEIKVVVVDTEGKPLTNRKVNIGLYNARWNWWYDRGNNQRYNYNSSSHLGAVQTLTLTTDSKGQLTYKPQQHHYGNYMIRVCDELSGHCTGDLFYTGNSWYRSKEEQGPQLLSFKTDKDRYNLGENILVTIPSNEGSKILISLENGERVLSTYWVDGKASETKIDIPTQEDMGSNVYIHAHFVQAHNNGKNDLPIRMYGIVPVTIINPKTTLHPEIAMDNELSPNSTFKVKVSEADGNAMSYTLAVVDEGLLDLTRFKTPKPWEHFYSKQSLGVKTWDIYDYVLDGYGGNVDKFISIGGDGAAAENIVGTKVNRFKPMVKFLGPFSLEANGTNSHEIQMPNYVGSVRTMVVARHHTSYGNTDKTTPVKKPLMVQATLPRVLGPGETLKLSANVFAMDKKISKVDVKASTTPNIKFSKGDASSLKFSEVEDKYAGFDIMVENEVGNAKVKVQATGSGESAYDEIDIEIRNPNPVVSKFIYATVEPGKTWTTTYDKFGIKGTNAGYLEVWNIANIDLGKRLNYLVRYPYGCLEQTTSSVFPQLYLNEVALLDANRQRQVERNISAGIKRLETFLVPQGGFAYWPGNSDYHEWGSIYATHFLLEAQEKGYFVPSNMLNNVITYINTRAEQNINGVENMKTQAYRLYILAKAGKANVGAMNRLKNIGSLDITSSHILGAAYALVGKKDIANKLIFNSLAEIPAYDADEYTFGSNVRDQAIIVEALLSTGKTIEAMGIIKDIGQAMNSDRWYSTQTTAFSILALGKYMAINKSGELSYDYALGNDAMSTSSTSKASAQHALDIEHNSKESITLKNNSKIPLYVKLATQGQLPVGEGEEEIYRHITLKVDYTDLKGNPIDIIRLQQGTDFVAKVEVGNLGTKNYNLTQMALTQIIPSGWEIRNDRPDNDDATNISSLYEYRDIRDDRVSTFFDIRGRTKKTFTVHLTASFEGRFYLPSVYAEAMYDNEIQAKNKGQWIEVVKSYGKEEGE